MPPRSQDLTVPSDLPLPAVTQKMTLNPIAPCAQAYKWISGSICLRLGVIKRMYFRAKYNKQSAQTFSGLLISQGKRELGAGAGDEAGVLQPRDPGPCGVPALITGNKMEKAEHAQVF